MAGETYLTITHLVTYGEVGVTQTTQVYSHSQRNTLPFSLNIRDGVVKQG